MLVVVSVPEAVVVLLEAVLSPVVEVVLPELEPLLSVESAVALPAEVVDVVAVDDPAEPVDSAPPAGAVPCTSPPFVAVGDTSFLWVSSSVAETGRGGVGAPFLVMVVAVPATSVTPFDGAKRLVVRTTPSSTATPVTFAW